MRPVITVLLLIALPSPAFATTGWDRHRVDILGKYRIHGVNGQSYVHRIDSEGQCIEPPLCNTLDASGVLVFYSPPDYAVTKSHIVIRYPSLDGAEKPNHFLIWIADGNVVGPFTTEEFKRSSVFADAEGKWKSPATAADRFQRVIWFMLTSTLLVFFGIAMVSFLWIRNRLRSSIGSKRDRKAEFNS